MIQRVRWTAALVAALMLTTQGLSLAADFDKALREAEGRKRAAETGARAIRAKAPQEAEAVRPSYTEAAEAHDAWLTATTDAIEKGTPEADVSASASTAASAFVRWVAARNRALGEAVLAGANATTVESVTRRGLMDITSEAARKQRGADAKKRSQGAAELRTRVRWTPWSEL